MNKINFILIWIVLFSSLSIAEINSDQWLIQQLQVDDGLPNSTVFSVQQDKTGFIWFGTVNGVARYDGFDFKIYKHDGADLNTISNNNAGNIFVDSKNTLWIGTFGGGFNTLDLKTGLITRHPYSSKRNESMVSEFVQTFHEDQNSNLWIGTASGLYKYTNKIVRHYDHKKGDNNSLIHSRIWDITEDNSGNIWVGTSQGLSKIDSKTDQISNFELPKNLVEDISSNEFRKLHVRNNQLWIGSSSALNVFDLSSEKFHSYALKYNIKINDLILIEDKFLVATMGGLYQFDTNINSFVKNENGELWRSLEHNDIRRMLIDKSGLLWLATRDSGVFKIDQTGGLFENQQQIYADKALNILSQKIWAIEFDEEGKSYLGTSDTLFKKSPGKSIIRIATKNNNQIPGRIRALKFSKDKNLWIGSSDGLFKLNSEETIAKEILEPFEILDIKPADIFSIEETNSGELWLSLNNLGILRWNPNEKTAQLLQNYKDLLLTDLNIGKIFQDSNQDIWITTNLVGLIKFDTKNEQMTLFSHDYSNKDSISSNRVRDIYEDSQDRLWVGTARGMNLFDRKSNTFKVYRTSDGLLEESILSILEDSRNTIWASHNFGISSIKPEEDSIKNYKINSAIRKDGLNIRAANIDANNQLLFGSINGLYTFDSNELQTCIEYLPELVLTEVFINNSPLSAIELANKDTNFSLSSKDQSIYFEFSALDFYSQDSVKYFYKISGTNDKWKDVTETQSIELNNLTPGKYNLEIIAKNSDCRWLEQTLNLSIKVHPVWWNLWWVRLIFLFSGILVAFLYHYFRSNLIRKRNLDLEKLVENRTSELMILNEKLKSASQTDFLTGLLNRTGFINNFNQIKLSQAKTPRNIVLADCDHFKKINDKYGHLAGDKVLIEITNIMKSFIKDHDFVARWGGEEFIFYFEGKNQEEVYSIIEDIRKEIESSKILYSGHEIFVTCTFGICQVQSKMGLNQCIKAADESMYIGKSQGRNTTVVSQ